MQVKQEIKNDVYKKLINYMTNKCDVISFTKYQDQHEKEQQKAKKIILSNIAYSIEDIADTFSDTLLNEIYLLFKNDHNLFDEQYKKRYEKDPITGENVHDDIKYFNRQLCVNGIVSRIVYDYFTEKWLCKNIKQILFQENYYIEPINSKEKIVHHSTVYYTLLDNRIKEELLDKNSFSDWSFPTSLEDICFYKEQYCYLYSVSHEGICDIYCEDEVEYEYFKSLGIEFVEDKFIPEVKEKIKFEREHFIKY